MKGLGQTITFVFINLFICAATWAQLEVTCKDNNCSYPASLTVTPLNLTNFTKFEIPILTDALKILTPDGEKTRDFRTYVLTKNLTGEDIEVDTNSLTPTSKGSSFVLIGDSIRNLKIDTSGFSDTAHSNSSTICATKIKAGDYGSTVRSKFLARRTADPSINPNRCDNIDVQNVRDFSQVTCDPGFTETPTQKLTASRWKPKRVCKTEAGRAMCVQKRVALTCDMYADKKPAPANGCCNTPLATAPETTGWTCDPVKCNSKDSGWYKRYVFRMWEKEYVDLAKQGHSNEFICETKVASSGGSNGDSYRLVNKSYVTNLTYYNASSDFIITPPASETVVAAEFAAGECGSHDDIPNPSFTSYSEFFTPNGNYVRMKGNGHKEKCTGVYTDYASGTYCYNALLAVSNSSVCTGDYASYPPGNQCWSELLPTCTGQYDDYPNGSYCYNKLLTQCSGVYTDYPNGSYCYERLKRETCSGIFSDFPEGSTCWRNNQPTCSGVYTDYPEGSYCWQKLAPYCPQVGHDAFCGSYLTSYPANNVCLGAYSDFPVGSKCWQQLQPTCPGLYTSYPVNSYCYNKLAPTCTGNYSDYPTNSYCYSKLIPATCSGTFTDYPVGSFCYEKLQPTCTGVYSDYSYGSFCYNKLAPTSCPGTAANYPLGSFCRRQLASTCEGAWTDYPQGSYCWANLQPACSGAYTDYAAGSYCYNKLNPTQTNPLDDVSPGVCSGSDNSKIGSLCWSETFPACDPAGTHAYDSYCWHKLRATEFCSKAYYEYPKNSYCWNAKRNNPTLYYYSNNSCAVKCDYNGSFVSCNIGTPNNETIHEETTASFVGTRVHKDAWVSFKVRIRTLNALGLEKNNDTEVRINVRNSDY